MTSPQTFELATPVSRAFFKAQDFHGNLSLHLERYSGCIRSIIDKHCGANAAQSETACFFDSLHTDDLYLSIACAQGSDPAWDRFALLYKQSIYEQACLACRSRDEAHELTDKIVVDLFLPLRAGMSRIGSYEGRSSLSSWLRAIVRHRASDEQALKINRSEPLESAAELIDERCAERLNARLRAARYEPMIKDSLPVALSKLSDREHLMLMMRYENETPSVEIARALGVPAYALSRQMQEVSRKLSRWVVSTLRWRHGLSEAAVEECLVEIMENPAHSILDLIRR